jgi:hypothetical protein
MLAPKLSCPVITCNKSFVHASFYAGFFGVKMVKKKAGFASGFFLSAGYLISTKRPTLFSPQNQRNLKDF